MWPSSVCLGSHFVASALESSIRACHPSIPRVSWLHYSSVRVASPNKHTSLRARCVCLTRPTVSDPVFDVRGGVRLDALRASLQDLSTRWVFFRPLSARMLGRTGGSLVPRFQNISTSLANVLGHLLTLSRPHTYMRAATLSRAFGTARLYVCGHGCLSCGALAE